MATDGLVLVPVKDPSEQQQAEDPALKAILLALGISLVLHAMLALTVRSLPAAPQPKNSRQIVVNVDIVSPRSSLPGEPGTATQVEPLLPGGAAAIRPERMLAGEALADPRSKQALAALPTLETSTRAEQLCNVEAMAQIAAWKAQLEPDLVIAYAMADTSHEDGILTARGAALHSGKHWYRLAYRCKPHPAQAQVSFFEFSLGEPIPRTDWEDLGLPAKGDAAHDD